MTARVRIHSDGWRYHIRWFCEDRGAWGAVLDDFKYEFPQWERRFDGTTKTWSVPLHTRARLRDWAMRWFDADHREYGEDGPAGSAYGSRSNSNSGDGRYGEGQGSTGALQRAYAQLHLLPSAPPELVQAAHRILIKQVHPDAGGSHDAAVNINIAWERICADQEERRSA